MSTDTLIGPSVIIAIVAAIALWFRARRSRAAGASDARPCCTRCWYPVGSWSGPNCPECGADARALGVATGARYGRMLALQLVLCSAVGVLGAALMLARMFDGVVVETIGRTWVSKSSGLTVRCEAQYGGPLLAESTSENWVRGRLEFLSLKSKPADPAAVTLQLDGPARPLQADDVRKALMQATGSNDPRATEPDAAALHQMIVGFQQEVLDARYTNDPLWAVMAPRSPWSQIAGDGGSTPLPSTRGVVAAVVAATAVLVIGLVWAVRCFNWGSRRARDGEWSSPSRGG